ncbi:MAG: hypothetical protein NXI31_25945 [bacterium]|nr:hypothetical protein [bacterium]
METSSLAPICRALVAVLRRRWPEFLDCAEINELGDLVVNYPSPHRDDGEALWISADVDLDEIVIGFGHAHSHGGPWANPGDADFELRASERFIDDIVEERVVSCAVEEGARIGYLDEFRAASWWPSVRFIRSWRGTHDREDV